MWNMLQLTMYLVFAIHQVTVAQNDCGNTSFSGPEGVVTSPNFPLPYPHNISCTYSIDVGRNNSILLRFLDFDLELPIFHRICMNDWLTITCNETNDENLDFGSRYCGTDLPRTSLRFSNCPVVILEFFADASINGGGFSIEYTVIEGGHFVDNSLDLDCGVTEFTNSPGVIRLPTNPTDISARVNCTYTISTNYLSRIQLNVESLRRTQLLDSFADCSRDNITVGCVLDGRTEPNPSTRVTLCRRSSRIYYHHSIPTVFSNCRVLKIFMRSSDYNYRGDSSLHFEFHAMDVACGTTSFTGQTGNVTSPRFPLLYPHSLDCVYSIDVDRTKTVTLDFLSFQLEGQLGSECPHDSLTVRCSSDGPVKASPSQNRKYCGIGRKQMSLRYSNCDSLTLNFVSDDSVNYGGFKIRYTITSAGNTTPNATDAPDEGCGNTSFIGQVGFISSPRFPLFYPNDMDCVYSIDVDRTKMVILRFYSFDVEGVSHSSYLDSCSYDWLLVSCLSNGSARALHSHRNIKYCGAKTTSLILGYSNCDSLTLHFVTDSSVTSGGFRVRYTVTSADQSTCGETLFSDPKGIVTSPNYPFPYPNNMNCTYSIYVGPNNSVLLKFILVNLETPQSADYCKDWLMISCNATTRANPFNYRNYCGSIRWVSSMRFVDCPSLVLEFVSDSSGNRAGFIIEYTVVDNSNYTDDNFELDCGTTMFTNTSGYISLPRNTRNYLATVNCTYIVSAKKLSYISLNTYLSSWVELFRSFENCDTDSLTIGCVSEGETDPNENATKVLCRRGLDYWSYPTGSLAFADCRTLKLSIRSTHYDHSDTYRIPFTVLGSDEICGNTSFSASNGIISSPDLPLTFSKRINCLYTIDSGHVNSVVLNVYRLSFGYINHHDFRYIDHDDFGYDIDPDDEICDNGWLTITCLVNGTSVAHPLADKKLCHSSHLQTVRFTACRSVLLNYSIDYVSYDMEDMSYNMGFSVRYRMGDFDPECGNSSYSGPIGFITSPQFPLSYPHNLNCLYSITGGQKDVIFLSFLLFHLEGTSIPLSIDSCHHDWLTVSCLSDQFATASISSSRKYCGLKTTTLKFTFPNCQVVVLNFQSDSSINGGGFKVRYSVFDTDSICGVPDHGPPSGVISFPWNFTYIDCSYFINATELSSISLKIWSISLQRFVGRNCQNDWLLISCTNGQTDLDYKVIQRNCDQHNSSTQLIFSSCATVKVVYHKDSETTGKTFRIEYTITDDDAAQRTTELLTTATANVATKASCATGCNLSPNATFCECLKDDFNVTNQMNLSGERGHAVGISLALILVATGAICLAAFVVVNRRQKKKRSEMLLQANEEEIHQSELEEDTTKAGSLFRDGRNQEADTSRYHPLRPLSLSGHQDL